MLVEALLIFGLVWQRARRRTTESELKLSNDRLRKAVEAGKCVGWDWDVKTGRDRWFGDLQTMFGIQSDTYYGYAEDFRRRVLPGRSRISPRESVADARQNREPFIAEYRVLHLDGTMRWINGEGTVLYTEPMVTPSACSAWRWTSPSASGPRICSRNLGKRSAASLIRPLTP